MSTEEFRNRQGPQRETHQVQLPRTIKEFFEETVFERAKRASPKLRPQILGKVLIDFLDTGKKYLFDWSAETLKVAAADANAAHTESNIECKIKLSEKDFMRIAQGDLNPQIGLLSEKISIQGQAGLAIYFFNLVAPL